VALVATAGSVGWVLRDRALRRDVTERAIANFDRGSLLHSQGRLAEATTEYQAAIDLWKKIPDARPSLAYTYGALANVLGDQPHRLAEAWEAGVKGREILQELVDKYPDNLNFAMLLAISINNGGNGLWVDWNQYRDALEYWETAYALAACVNERQMRANIGELDKTLSTVRNRLCYGYATCPERSLRRPERSLQLAQEQHRESPGALSEISLAAALISAGKWRDSLDHLAKSNPPGDSLAEFSRLILTSIAEWQIGNRSESLEFRRRAQSWLEQNSTVANRNKFNRQKVSEMQLLLEETIGQPMH
jgi:tetratricopeptide (TPR) repeat protein